MSVTVTSVIKGLFLALVACASVGAAKPLTVGNLAPDFKLTLVDGTKITRDELRGNVVVLNFWATWCVPCRTELPLLDGYYAAQKQHGLKVFAITTEDSLPLFKLKALFAAMNIPSVRTINGPYANIKAVPTNYIIDRSGHIRYAKSGALDLDDLNEQIVPLLKEPAPTN